MVDPGQMQKLTHVDKVELTPEIVAQIKKELADQGLPTKIYKFVFDGDEFVFRPLYKKDWNRIQAHAKEFESTFTPDDLDEKICQTGVIFPDTMFHPIQWQVQRAGYSGSLAKLVLAKSGFYDPDVDQSDILSVEALGEVEKDPKPTDEIVAELKEKFPNWASTLKLVNVGDEYFVVRPITRGEWKGVQQDPRGDSDLATVERACVWSREYPEKPKYADKMAGTIRAISEVVMHISAFMVQGTVEPL
jgi:hypothetical protein